MKVLRIVPNIAAENVDAARRFYQDVLGLDVLMDMGWIATYGSGETAAVQVSIMSEGGSGTPVPDISVEVSDLDEALRRAEFRSCTDLQTSLGACVASSCAIPSASW